MQDAVDIRSRFNRDGLHQTATLGAAITRLFIDMPAPEAARAMIGIAIPMNLQPAMRTGEAFNGTLKSASHFAFQNVVHPILHHPEGAPQSDDRAYPSDSQVARGVPPIGVQLPF